jgi:hypothetical protein
MPRLMLSIGFAAACSSLAACTETFQRLDGVTPDAGNAIAANTVMQMVDPWQYGVQNTDLQVPADRGDVKAAAADDGSDSGSSNGDSSSGGKGTSTTGGSY